MDEEMKRVFIKQTQINKYKSTLFWYKTNDGVWLDNSYYVKLEDSENNIIEEIDKRRT
ncbi:unnamed protein product, partial [marine sediment metagenome]